MATLKVVASAALAQQLGELYGIEAHAGHTAVEWDPAVKTEEGEAAVREAERIFTELREAGMAAYRVEPGGEPEQMTAFDPAASEILLIPPIVGG